jgi:DNA anti-recombination protein RmuC
MNMPRGSRGATMSNDAKIAVLETIAASTHETLIELKSKMNSLEDSIKQGFARVDLNFVRVDQEMKQGFTRVDQEMKQGFARVDQEMKQGFARVDQDMKQGFARVDQEMKQGFRDVNNRIWTNFFWMIGGFASLLGLFAHAFHWI